MDERRWVWKGTTAPGVLTRCASRAVPADGRSALKRDAPLRLVRRKRVKPARAWNTRRDACASANTRCRIQGGCLNFT